MQKSIVNYAETLRENDTLVLPDEIVFPVARITKAQGRKPANGENIYVHGVGGRVRLNTRQVVRIIRAQ